ncbi:MAG TPA: aldehyde dehydrogenase family protein, partial [Kiritimatiellia bacterium]|nr:aldehyde dehydrogenase family protein [Kiritimatiellia bacterium]
MKYSNLANFIDGKPSNPKVPRAERFSPVDGSLLSTIPMSDAAELDRAVQAARKAFPAWSG